MLVLGSVYSFILGCHVGYFRSVVRIGLQFPFHVFQIEICILTWCDPPLGGCFIDLFLFNSTLKLRARGIQHQQLIATCPSDQLVTCCSVVVSGVAAIRWIWWLAGLHLLIPGGDLSTCCFQLRWQSLLVV